MRSRLFEVWNYTSNKIVAGNVTAEQILSRTPSGKKAQGSKEFYRGWMKTANVQDSCNFGTDNGDEIILTRTR